MSNKLTILSRRDLYTNRKRNRLTTISISISVFLVCIVLAISYSFYRQMIAEMKIADENVLTVAFGNKENTLNYTYLRLYTENDINLVSNAEGVLNATGVKGLATEAITYDGGRQIIASTIKGIDEDYLTNLNLQMYDGKMPVNDNEILIGYSIYKSTGLNVGDTIQAVIEGTTVDFLIAGVIEEQQEQSFSTLPSELNQMIAVNNSSKYVAKANYIFISAMAEDVNKLSAICSNILDNLETDQDLMSSLDGTGLEPVVATRQDVIDMLDTWFIYIDCFVVGLAILVAIISAINIINIFAITIQEKHKDIAVYKIVGASEKQIQKIYIYQSMILGVRGSLIGMIGGLMCSAVFIYLMDWPNGIKISSIAFPLLVGIGTSTVSGFIVSKKTRSIDVNILMNS